MVPPFVRQVSTLQLPPAELVATGSARLAARWYPSFRRLRRSGRGCRCRCFPGRTWRRRFREGQLASAPLGLHRYPTVPVAWASTLVVGGSASGVVAHRLWRKPEDEIGGSLVVAVVVTTSLATLIQGVCTAHINVPAVLRVAAERVAQRVPRNRHRLVEGVAARGTPPASRRRPRPSRSTSPT